METKSTQPERLERQAKKVSQPAPPKRKSTNAWRERDWETLFVTAVFVASLAATAWMVIISITDPDPDNRYRIIPAASLMVMVELWLIVTLPIYGRLAFWGAVISLATFLFFAVPFIFLGLLPSGLMIGGTLFTIVSLVCGLFLYRQRDRFFPPPPPKPARK